MYDKSRKRSLATAGLIACAAAALVAGAAEEEREEGDVVVVAKTDTLPNAQVNAKDMTRIEPLLKALPDGHRLRIEFSTTAKALTGYDHDIRWVKRITTLDADGNPDGPEIEYRDWYRRASREAAYKNGKNDGMERIYDVETGNLIAEIPWVNGKIHGVKKTFHANGKLANETTYDQGEIKGASRSFDAEGRLIRIVTFSHGQRDGDMTEFWPENPKQIKQVVPYRQGVIEGVARAFYLNGKPKWVRPFKNNRQHGVEQTFDGEGNLEKTVYWLNGNQVSEEEYRKAGEDR